VVAYIVRVLSVFSFYDAFSARRSVSSTTRARFFGCLAKCAAVIFNVSFAKTGAALLSGAIANVSGPDRPEDRDGVGRLGVPTWRAFGRRSAAFDVQRAAAELTSGGASFVPVVQAADFPECDHLTVGDALHASRRRRVFRQREMSSRFVRIGERRGQDTSEVPRAESDHMVQTLPPDGSDQPSA
jgi:hypothetical protein